MKSNDIALELMKDNLLVILVDDLEFKLTPEVRHILKSVSTVNDLYDFLCHYVSIDDMIAEEVFGLTLSLIFPSTGFDAGSPTSDRYRELKEAELLKYLEPRVKDPDIYSQHPTFYGEFDELDTTNN